MFHELVIFFCHRLTSCSMNCQRRMTCFVLFRLLLRRVKQIPAVPHHFVSMSLSMYHMICCSWMSCKINSESWKRRTLLSDQRYIRLTVYTLYAGYKINQDGWLKNPAGLKNLGFSWIWLFCMAVYKSYPNTFPPPSHPSVSFTIPSLQNSLEVFPPCLYGMWKNMWPCK